jgi:hypothetical protein
VLDLDLGFNVSIRGEPGVVAAILTDKGRHIVIILKSTFYKGIYIIFLTS